MSKKVTIKDVADLAGVSKSTVSRYLNNGYVSEQKADTIRKIIKTTGFNSNFFASRMKTRYSKLIGIVLPRLDSYSVGQMLTGINNVLNQKQYQAIIMTSNLNTDKEIQAIHQFKEQGVDAIIVISVGITDKLIKNVSKYPLPIIFAGQADEHLFCVKFDDYKAGFTLGKYLNSKFKTCVFLGVSSVDKAIGIDRFNGFSNGFKGKIHLIKTDFSFEQAYMHGDRVMKFAPEVVVGATDNIALGFMQYLHKNHISVPSDISVAGFGGYPIGDVASTPLTTVSFDFKSLGSKIAESSFDLLYDSKTSSYLDDNFKLIIKESTK